MRVPTLNLPARQSRLMEHWLWGDWASQVRPDCRIFQLFYLFSKPCYFVVLNSSNLVPMLLLEHGLHSTRLVQTIETMSGNLTGLWGFILQPATAKLSVKCLELISALSFASLDLWFQQESFHSSIHFFTAVLSITELHADGVGKPETPFFSSLPT